MIDRMNTNHPEVEWTKIFAFRNILVRDYDVIDENIVWNIITVDLTELKDQIISLAKMNI